MNHALLNMSLLALIAAAAVVVDWTYSRVQDRRRATESEAVERGHAVHLSSR
jgi:hypothetical protein